MSFLLLQGALVVPYKCPVPGSANLFQPDLVLQIGRKGSNTFSTAGGNSLSHATRETPVHHSRTQVTGAACAALTDHLTLQDNEWSIGQHFKDMKATFVSLLKPHTASQRRVSMSRRFHRV